MRLIGWRQMWLEVGKMEVERYGGGEIWRWMRMEVDGDGWRWMEMDGDGGGWR